MPGAFSLRLEREVDPMFPTTHSPSSRPRPRIVVIGAGPGGLSTAMLLASAGADVTVVERQPRVGGRTSALEEEGFRFDLGPTFFLYPPVLREIFAACGRDLDDEVDLVQLDPQYDLRFEDGSRIRATPDVARLEQEIARLAPADAANLRAFLADNRKKFGAFKPILQSPFQGWGDFLKLPFHKLMPLMRPGSSVDGDLRRFFADERVRLAFSFQSKYLGMSPFQCPSLFTILSFLEYEYGVHHPIGGCAALSEAMARVAREMGVTIRTGEPVEEVLFEGRRAVGVRTNQELLQADRIVVNADFARAMENIVPDRLRRRWTDRKLAKKRYSCSTFMLYLGIEGLYKDLDHHTIYFADGYEENLKDIEKRHVLNDNPSFYVQNACVTDPTLARPGTSTLYVLVPVTHTHGNVDWEQERPRYRDLIVSNLARIGLDDVESRILYEKVVTPHNWEVDHQIYRGATFNLAHNLGQMLHLRPRNRFDELEGVYLVGGGTHPGSGLPVIFESARITARLLTEDLDLEYPTAEKTDRHPVRAGDPSGISSLAG